VKLCLRRKTTGQDRTRGEGCKDGDEGEKGIRQRKRREVLQKPREEGVNKVR
jgi:hypothetical protein